MSDPPAGGDINFSSAVSEVFRDIGVTDDMVKRRRESLLLIEALWQVKRVMINGDKSMFFFGSQSEGTTTIGMDSDVDGLFCYHQYNAIQDLSDWKPNKINILMIQDDTTAPCYCHLQLLKNDKPLPSQHVPDRHFINKYGHILVKNTLFHELFNVFGNSVQHGPAVHFPKNDGGSDIDYVPAIHCNSWPKDATNLLKLGGEHSWLTEEMKNECRKSGCFLVPVGSRVNGYNELEWRISTHHAERCLMFSLGIIQLGCYILMKLLLKSHINRGCEGVISSYMCKTVMMYCVAKKPDTQFWQENNIIPCLNYVLRELYYNIQSKTCQHFVVPGNNLMAEKISDEHQQLLLENIHHIIDSNGTVLFEIKTDAFGMRLQRKLVKTHDMSGLIPSAKAIHHRFIAGDILRNIAKYNTVLHLYIMYELNITDGIQVVLQQLLCFFNRCMRQYLNSSHREQEAHKLMLRLLCTTIASLRAIEDITLNRPVSSKALFKLGLISDVSSGWLKLATVHYSSGDFKATESILRRVEQKYDRRYVLPVCGCYESVWYHVPGFDALAEHMHNNCIRHCVSYCVMFMRCERIIVPQEMQQEFYRSTAEQIQDRTYFDTRWKDFAVVDSLPYLYFLQYKTHGRLGNREEQLKSLDKLKHIIRIERNFSHKETALNLLGQCWEAENQPNKAFRCFRRSLRLRPYDNAAQFHITRMVMNYIVEHTMGNTRI